MDYLIQLDHSLFYIINHSLTHPVLDVFFPLITDLHKQLWFKILVYPLFLFFYVRKYKKVGLLYFVFFLLSIGFSDWSGSTFIKKIVERPRPFETEGVNAIKRSNAHGFSFISNHATNMFAFATYASAFFPPARFVFFAAAGLVAYSRVYNGVHFPLDVICGALWGISIGLLFIWLARWTARRKFSTA